jgi:hypothetical protein
MRACTLQIGNVVKMGTVGTGFTVSFRDAMGGTAALVCAALRCTIGVDCARLCATVRDCARPGSKERVRCARAQFYSYAPCGALD